MSCKPACAPRAAVLLAFLVVAGCGGGGSGSAVDVPPAGGGTPGTGATAADPGAAGEGPVLAIDPEGYVLVSQQRLSRDEYEYTYRATVVNTGSEAINVVGTVTTGAAGVSVTDPAVAFQAVPPGGRVLSDDTFTIRQVRTGSIAAGDFAWSFTFLEPFEPALEPESRRAAEVPVTGGSVAATGAGGGGFVLEVPAAALAEPREIAMTPITGGAGIAGLGQFVAGVRLEPDGTRFRLPASVGFTGVTDDPAGLRVFSISADGRTIEPLSFGIAADGRLVASVGHFSDIVVVSSEAADCTRGAAGRQAELAAFERAAGPAVNPTIRALNRIAIHRKWAVCAISGEVLYQLDDWPADIAVELSHWYAAVPGGIAWQLDQAASVASVAEIDYGWSNDFGHWLNELWTLARVSDLADSDDGGFPVAAARDALSKAEGIFRHNLGLSEVSCANAQLRTGDPDDTEAWETIYLAAAFEFSIDPVFGTTYFGDEQFGFARTLVGDKQCGTVDLKIDPEPVLVGVGQTVSPDALQLGSDGQPSNARIPRVLRWSAFEKAPPFAVGAVSGKVTGLAAGTGTLSVEHLGSVGWLMEDTAAVEVRELEIDIQPVSAAVRVGESVQLTASPRGSTGQPDSCAYQWFSSNTATADVAISGPGTNTATVTAKGVGEVNITATCGSELGAARIVTYDRIDLRPALACFGVGEPFPFSVNANGYPVTASVDWQVSPALASVGNGGVATGLAPGTAAVTAVLGDPADKTALRSSATLLVTPVPTCGTWDLSIEDVQVSPRPWSTSMSRVIEVVPGVGAEQFVAQSTDLTRERYRAWYSMAPAFGSAALAMTVSGSTVTWSSITYEVFWYVCEQFTGTLTADGRLSGVSQWTEHRTRDCSSSAVASGYSVYSGVLRH